MLYGYKGQLLHIDLSKETHHNIPIPEKILGKYYVLYFDEKRNRLARPPQ